MNLNDLFGAKEGWLKSTGPDSDIVISSRIRLARNLSSYRFTDWADRKDREKVLEEVKRSFDKNIYLKKSLFLKLEELDEIDKRFLLERQLISRELISKKGPGAVCISEKEIFSIMVNEEDHLRIQVIQSGFNLLESWRIIEKITDALSSELEFAYSPKLGYLTACPTNAGTGMRASAMMHLPGLIMKKSIEKILEAIAKLSFTTRGLYGEGTEAAGNFFQISNQATLGRSELDIINNLERIIKQVVDYEKKSRLDLLENHSSALEDKIWRAYGILKNARFISSDETMELLSMVRLGVDAGLIKDIERSLINELFVLTQPAHLQKMEHKKLTPAQRDSKRAQLIREKIK